MKGINLGESVRNSVWAFTWGFAGENAYESVDHNYYIFVHDSIWRSINKLIHFTKTIRDGINK